MSNNRIRWIDATKGLLILLMVLGHIHNIAGKHGIQDDYLIKCTFFSSLYSCFFMQAFLVLTGYTSNFEKKIKLFLVSQLKTIVIPWFVFSVLCQIYRGASGDHSFFININNQNFFFLFEDFWFLHVIFFGKLFYYFVFKYIGNDIVRASLLLLMMVSGFAIFTFYKDSGNTYHYYNYLHYKDFLCMTFFLWFGNFSRRKEIFKYLKGRILIIIIFLYIIGHAFRLYFRLNDIDDTLIAPVILSHGGNAMSLVQIPAYIYYVILGSLSCFGIMQYIGNCRFLEYFGLNSLVVYCVHFVFLALLVEFIGSIISPDNIVSALVYTILTLFSCLLSCVVVIQITKHKPFNFLIGKF